MFLLPITKGAVLNTKIICAAIEHASRIPCISFRIAHTANASASDLSFIQKLQKSYPKILPEETPYLVDFSKKNEISMSMEGCAGVIISSGADDLSLFESEINILKAVQTTNTPNVIKLSCAQGLLGENSSVNTGRIHWAVEQHAREIMSKISGSTLTLLRPNTMMENFLYGSYHRMICGRSLCVSVKHGRVAFVDAKDVAEVAVHALHNSVNSELILTGSNAFSFPEVASLFSHELHQTVNYSYMPLWAVQPSMWIRGERSDAISNEIETARALENGAEEIVTTTIEDILGRKPMSFQAFIHAHKDGWPLQGFR